MNKEHDEFEDKRYVMVDSTIETVLNIMKNRIIRYHLINGNRCQFYDDNNNMMIWDTSEIKSIIRINHFVILETDIGNKYYILDINYIDELYESLSSIKESIVDNNGGNK